MHSLTGLRCLTAGSCDCKGAGGAQERLKGEGSYQAHNHLLKDAADKNDGTAHMSVLGEPHFLRLPHNCKCIVSLLCSVSTLCTELEAKHGGSPHRTCL